MDVELWGWILFLFSNTDAFHSDLHEEWKWNKTHLNGIFFFYKMNWKIININTPRVNNRGKMKKTRNYLEGAVHLPV